MRPEIVAVGSNGAFTLVDMIDHLRKSIGVQWTDEEAWQYIDVGYIDACSATYNPED